MYKHNIYKQGDQLPNTQLLKSTTPWTLATQEVGLILN